MLVGGGGYDVLQGGTGSDTLYVGDDPSQLFGGLDNDVLSGGANADQLSGDAGMDVLVGGGGDDSLYGGADTDLLVGGDGADILDGGEGNDWVEVDALDIAADGGDGFLDVLLIVGSAVGLGTIDLGNSGNQNAGAGPVLTGFEAVDAGGASAGISILGAVHDGGFGNLLSGSAFADTIFGSAAADIIVGRDGDDVLAGGGGDDSLDGGDGVDMALFQGVAANYEFELTASGVIVRGNVGGDGVDVLSDVELLSFADQVIDLRLGPPAPANNLPIAEVDEVITLQDTATIISPLDNDTDADGDVLSLVGLASEPEHGSVTIHADGTLTYTPSDGYSGADSLEYVVSDGHGGNVQGTILLTVDAVPEGADGRNWINGGSPVPMANPSQTGDVVGVRLQNLSATNGSGQVLTFGEVFLDGEIAAGSHLMARIGGQLVPVQMDVKTTYADGSVKHAILSVAPTALTGNGSTAMMLTTAGAGATGPALSAGEILSHNYNLKVEIDFRDGQGVHTIDAAQVLSQAIQAGKVETWLSGPLASEFRVETTVAGDLKAKFDIRLTADGGIDTNVILARDATYVDGPNYMKSITYDATIKSNGVVAAQYNAISHNQNANWHEEIWSGARAQVNVVHDVDHLVATGAVPTYDTSLGVNEGALNGLTTGNIAPMGNGTVEKYMPQTGGRADIGMLPTWAVQYLLSQDPRAAATMFANADASGSIPWHFIDEATNDPVRLDRHPELWTDGRQPPGSNPSALPKTFDINNTGWQPEVAHEPSLTYLPYLITGSHYYLDELQAQTAFNMIARYPGYREANADWFYDQLRGEAWDLRTLGQAVFATPDNDPMKAYFDAVLTEQLSHLTNVYITSGKLDGSGQIEGFFRAAYPETETAPWQNDFLATALAQLVDQGFGQAGPLLQWAENYLAGRYLNGDNGYDPKAGPTYYLTFINPATRAYYDTWGQLYQANFATNTSTEFGYGGAYPDWAGGYAAGARAAMAGLFNVTHSVDALEAFGYVISQTQNGRMPADFSGNPTFFMTPRLPDGSVLAIGDMKVASGAGPATLSAGSRPSLLYGGTGKDNIVGGSKSDVLFGGAGNDTIKGGPGNDYLYGGKGDDRLEGGPGADTFVFDRVNAGHDVIADFKPGEDRIAFGKANVTNQGLTAEGLLTGATVDGSGNLVLHPGEGSDITLVGVHQGELSAADIAVE